MGFKISWIGFEGVDRETCLKRLEMADTGIVDEANESPFSLAELPNGWSILFVNDFEYASLDRLKHLSRHGRVLGCQIHEGVMYSQTSSCTAGNEDWAVHHVSDEGSTHLAISGTMPELFDPIRLRLEAEQVADGGEHSAVDFIFDIPVDLAFAITGFRYDRWKFDWGEPHFTQVDARSPGKRAWWHALLPFKRP